MFKDFQTEWKILIVILLLVFGIAVGVILAGKFLATQPVGEVPHVSALKELRGP